MNKCPYCEYVTPTEEEGTTRAWQEIAHMELAHSDIIKDRLTKAGILDMSVRFGEDDN